VSVGSDGSSAAGGSGSSLPLVSMFESTMPTATAAAETPAIVARMVRAAGKVLSVRISPPSPARAARKPVAMTARATNGRPKLQPTNEARSTGTATTGRRIAARAPVGRTGRSSTGAGSA
jgi:hypothetical protein